MRLLDQITQHATPLIVIGESGSDLTRPLRLPGAADFAAQIRACPLRYVLSDQLAAVCAELALAGGDRLSSCLDLIHLPAETFWIEWSESARARAAAGQHPCSGAGAPLRVGALVRSSLDGRRGVLRTFWEDEQGVPCLAPLETHLDLACRWPPAASLQSLLNGGLARLSATDDPGLEELLECMRFRYDPQWAAYYRDAHLAAEAQVQLLYASLATVARDMPLVLAFALLLGARNALATRRVDREQLNRRRRLRNQRPLLEHLEVSCRLDVGPCAATGHGPGRRAPRLHYVRGHLLRRANEIYWRKTHMRGRAVLGRVHSRTVRLSFGAAPAP